MFFRSIPSHLPLDRDSSARFLPSIVALMVALLTFSILGLAGLNQTAGQWSTQIEGSLSIQVPPTDISGQSPEAREQALQKQVDQIVGSLREIPGVSKINELSPAGMSKLLEPWLGPEDMISELPIPRIIEITPSGNINTQIVKDTLKKIAPEAVLDDHRIWIKRISDVAFSVELSLIALIVVLFGATILSVVFATRSALSVHHNIIELLHLIGAQDVYIARQFGRHNLRLAFWGAIIGLIISVAVATLIAWLGTRAGWIVPDLFVSPGFILLIVALPFAIAAIAYFTATRTVRQVLRTML